MRRRDYYWSLFHSHEKRQLNDLRTDQIEAIFEAIPEINKKDWLIWREGFRSWKPFGDFTQLIVSLRKAANVIPPPEDEVTIPAPESSAHIDDQDGDDIGLSIDSDNPSEGRVDGRYNKKFNVRVFTQDQAFPNVTANISIKGMQLTSPLPKGLSHYFSVEVDLKGAKIPLICSEIPSGEKDSPRLRIEVNNYMQALQTAILAR